MSDAQVPEPRPVQGAEIRDIDLTGYLFPWNNSAPVLVNLDGTDDYFLPLFSSLEKLHNMASVISVEVDAIKRIDDGIEFLDSIPTQLAGGERLRIMVDPYKAEDNKTRFTEVLR